MFTQIWLLLQNLVREPESNRHAVCRQRGDFVA